MHYHHHYFAETKHPVHAQHQGDIHDINQLQEAVKEIGDWRSLCMNLGVDSAIMDELIHAQNKLDKAKKADCLQAYIDSGEAHWCKVADAVSKYPVNKRRIGNIIRKEYCPKDSNVILHTNQPTR